MNHAVRAVIALALGAGLAAAAQAQITGQQQNAPPTTQMQSSAPTQMQSSAPASTMQAPAPQKQKLHVSARKISTRGTPSIRQLQLRLKSAGLFRGRVTGRMDRQTRIALARFQKANRLPQTASLNRATSARLMGTRVAHATARMPKAQTTGVGSSTPSTASTPMAPSSTNPAPAAAGGTGSTAPSTPSATTGQTGTTQPITGTTQPITGTTKK